MPSSHLPMSYINAIKLYQGGQISHYDVCDYIDLINLSRGKTGIRMHVYTYPPKFNIGALQSAKLQQCANWRASFNINLSSGVK